MAIRGRGNGRGRGSSHNNPPDCSQSRTSSPLLQPSSRSPAASPLTIGDPSTAIPPSTTVSIPIPPSTTVPVPVPVPIPVPPTTIDVSVPPPTVPLNSDPISMPSNGASRTETDRRLIISVEDVSQPRRFVPQFVTREIMATVISRMPIPVEKWKNYPANMKDELFQDFMNKYRFASDYDHCMVRTVWDRTCMDRYSDDLKNHRKAIMKKLGTSNMADLKGHGPPILKSDVWDGLVDIWLTPEWQKKSVAGRSNRAAVPDAMLHTAGSISFGQHKKMEVELNRPVPFRDLYESVHKRKNGEYVTQRSKEIIDSYDTTILDKYGEDSLLHPMVDQEVWMQVTGPNKKGRVHGMSHSLGINIHESSSTSFSHVGGSCCTVPTQAIKEAVNEAIASFVQTQLGPILRDIVGSQARSGVPQTPSQGHSVREDNEANDDETNLD